MGDVKAEILSRAKKLGFDAVGFARAEISPAQRAGFREFLAAGHHGEMGWMAARADERGDPKVLWPEVKTLISVGISYAPAGDALAWKHLGLCAGAGLS
jgi:epoxyqueuosine reductase